MWQYEEAVGIDDENRGRRICKKWSKSSIRNETSIGLRKWANQFRKKRI